MSSPRSWVVLGVLVVSAACAVGAAASQQQTEGAGPAYKKVGSWGTLARGTVSSEAMRTG